MKRSLFALAVVASVMAACSDSAQQPQPARDAAAPSAAASPQTSAQQPAASTPPAAAPAAAASPSATPAPTSREMTIPAGTSLSVKVSSAIGSDTSKVEDVVHGSLAKPIEIEGTTVAPAGAELSGSVIDAKESGRVKGKASIAFRFDRLVVRGETYRIQTARIVREAAQDKRDDVKKGGIGAGIGAVVGGVVGGGKGAAIGAVAGGTGAVLATKGREIHIAPGTVVTATLQEAVPVQVPIK